MPSADPLTPQNLFFYCPKLLQFSVKYNQAAQHKCPLKCLKTATFCSQNASIYRKKILPTKAKRFALFENQQEMFGKKKQNKTHKKKKQENNGYLPSFWIGKIQVKEKMK